MLSLFKRKNKTSKKKAIVFVDYEHWFISLYKLHNASPDIKAFRDELSSRFEILEIMFFADFSNHTIRSEIPKIRQVSNFIIETQNVLPTHKKDFTDFIMLDHIYQKAINTPDADVFILFSGDGHFSSVVNYLISKLGKEVGIYAVRGGMSNQLKNTASWTELIPKNSDPSIDGYKMILSSLRRLYDNKQKKAYPTFWGTVEAVSRYNHIRKRDVSNMLRSLIAKDCIKQETVELSDGKVNTLTVDWQKCKILGFWE